ncbi:MAG: phosphotransferase [Candidatus Omnitrophota bacterium]
MTDIKTYVESKLNHVQRITKIKGEASTRNFFRIVRDTHSLVAMVYPESPNALSEIRRILHLTSVYREHAIRVPEIKDVLDDRILLQEDLGDVLAQRVFYAKGFGDPKNVLLETADILLKLKAIPVCHTASTLDQARMKWEMDFFITHFATPYLPIAQTPDGRSDLQAYLYTLVDRIHPIDTFAHRDFHSRNMLLHPDNGRLYLVDFQDSLVASPYYDLVSFAFDSYLDLNSRRAFLLDTLRERGMKIDSDLLYAAALQRNIKALGTFGFQVGVRKNLSYKKYIPRTLRHIRSNPLLEKGFDIFDIFDIFNRVLYNKNLP